MSGVSARPRSTCRVTYAEPPSCAIMSSRSSILQQWCVAFAAVVVTALAATTGATAEETRSDEGRTPLAPYWEDRWRGWHFYEDPPLPAPAPKPVPPERLPAAKVPDIRPPEVVVFERLQKRLEDDRQ